MGISPVVNKPDPTSRIRRSARLRSIRHGVTALSALVVLIGTFASARNLIGSQPHSTPSAIGRSTPQTTPGSRFIGRLKGELAYKCQDYICLMAPDGSMQRTLTTAFPEWDPTWAPNGLKLAFRGYYGLAAGDYAIYTVQANGCQLARLPNSAQGSDPTWSPTGRQIAFVTPGQTGIKILNTDGTTFSVIRRRSPEAYMSPAWSVRNVIAFVGANTSGPTQIYTIRPDGNDLRQITHGSSGFNNPSWSPTGKQIAFATSSGSIEVANANGTGIHSVSPPKWSSSNPVWTPTNKLVFIAQASGHVSTYAVNPDGTNLRELNQRFQDPQTTPTQIVWGAASLPRSKCSATSPAP